MYRTNIDEFKLIGLKLNKKTTNEGGQSNIDCGGLWQKFEINNYVKKIPNKLGEEIYAVYYAYESNDTMPFSYFIGCRVAIDTVIPEGMEGLLIPSNDYYKVIAKGKMTGCITDAWKRIWSSKIKRAYQYDFEVYDERSKDWNDAEMEIYVSTI